MSSPKWKNFFDICKSDAFKLLSYSAKMYEQLEWESRDSYAKLMDDFELEGVEL